MDVNFIAVNWTEIDTLFYPWARGYVPVIGQRVAFLLDFLRTVHAVPLSSVHLIGHSLGAHISGMAGSMVQWGTVGRITGRTPLQCPAGTVVLCAIRSPVSDGAGLAMPRCRPRPRRPPLSRGPQPAAGRERRALRGRHPHVRQPFGLQGGHRPRRLLPQWRHLHSARLPHPRLHP